MDQVLTWFSDDHGNGAVAQLGEHLLCKQGVSGSIPLSSTMITFGSSGWALSGLIVFYERKKVCSLPLIEM